MNRARSESSEERQLALLVASTAEYAIFIVDPEGRVVTWNRGAERMKGYTRDEIVGRHLSVFATPEDQARDHPAEELRTALREGSYEEEGWRVRKDGSRFWAHVTVTPIYEDGSLIGFGTVSRDLTERRQDEERAAARTDQLVTANERLSEFERLVASVRDYAIFMLDPTGHIRTWNAGAQQLKGYLPEEIIGRHFSIFYTDADNSQQHPLRELEHATREGRYEEEGWRVRKDGSTFWASVTITAVHDEQRRLTGFAKVTRDLTERKQAEESLREAVRELRRANHELDRFATVAAHDMTDPLRTISGFAELLHRGALTPEQSTAYAAHIQTSSLRLSDMLQDLLTFARAGRVEEPVEPVEVDRAVARVVADLSSMIADRGAEIEVELPIGIAVSATTRDVELILQNLITNAVKFADPASPRVVIAAEADDRAVEVTVEDNGPGIAAVDQERIFGAFERADSGPGRAGYGLGLAICQRLVERHGGTIELDSEQGRGSRFRFRLAAAPPPSPASPTIS